MARQNELLKEFVFVFVLETLQRQKEQEQSRQQFNSVSRHEKNAKTHSLNCDDASFTFLRSHIQGRRFTYNIEKDCCC